MTLSQYVWNKTGFRFLIAGAVGAFCVPVSAALAQDFYGTRPGECMSGASFTSRHIPAAGLAMFRFQKHGDDFNLRELELTRGLSYSGPTRIPVPGGHLQMRMNDKSSGDTCSFAVTLKNPPRRLTPIARNPSGTQTVSGECYGSCRVQLARPAADDVMILNGFLLSGPGNHSNADMRIKSIHIELNDAQHEALLSHSGNDERAHFYYTVQYSFIPRALVASQQTFSGNAPHGSGVNFGPKPAGETVIKSFGFRWLNGEHEVQKIGIDLTQPTMRGDFHDQNPDDQVQYFLQTVEFARI